MSLHLEPLSSLPQLRGLLEVSRLVREERDLTRLTDQIAATISDSLGWSTVAINLYRPASGDFEVTTVHGNDGAREALLGTTRPADAWTPLLAERFLRRGAYMIPHDEGDWAGLPSHIPDLSISLDPDAWHPEDALIVPMRGADGTLLGVVSVDEPRSGLRPSDEEIDVLVAFAEHVIAAFEGVQVAMEAARDRVCLRRLLDVSASLLDLDTADSVLENVARGIQEALEFDKVAVCLAHGGSFSPSGTAGWEPDDPGLDFGLTDGPSGAAARAGVRDRRVLPDRRRRRDRSRRRLLHLRLPPRRGRPACVVEPLAARAADRAGRLTQRLHLGRRPIRLPTPLA